MVLDFQVEKEINLFKDIPFKLVNSMSLLKLNLLPLYVTIMLFHPVKGIVDPMEMISVPLRAYTL